METSAVRSAQATLQAKSQTLVYSDVLHHEKPRTAVRMSFSTLQRRLCNCCHRNYSNLLWNSTMCDFIITELCCCQMNICLFYKPNVRVNVHRCWAQNFPHNVIEISACDYDIIVQRFEIKNNFKTLLLPFLSTMLCLIKSP